MSHHPLRRPYKLCLVTGSLTVVWLALPVHTLSSPVAVSPILAVFDIFFGVSGFIIMGYTSFWLWRRGRGWLATAGTFGVVTALMGVAVLRSALFAQADYERGRLPFAVGTWLMCLALTVVFWWGATRQRDDLSEETFHNGGTTTRLGHRGQQQD